MRKFVNSCYRSIDVSEESTIIPSELPQDPCSNWRQSEGLVVILSVENSDAEDEGEDIQVLLADGTICHLMTTVGESRVWVSPQGRWIVWFEDELLLILDMATGRIHSEALMGGPIGNMPALTFDPSETRVAISQIDWSTGPGEKMATPRGAWRLMTVSLESGDQEIALRGPTSLFTCWGAGCDGEGREGSYFTIVGWSDITEEVILALYRSVAFAEPSPESIWAVKVDGSSIRNLVGGPLQVGWSYWGKPALSPDGIRLAYFRRTATSRSLHTIDLVNGDSWSTALPSGIQWFEHYSLTWLPDNERLAYQVRVEDDMGAIVLHTFASDSFGDRAQWFNFEGAGTMQWCSDELSVFWVDDEIHTYNEELHADQVLGVVSNSEVLICWVGE